MFGLISELFFILANPFILKILNKKGYSEDSILRKKGVIQEEGFNKSDNVIMFHGVSVGEVVALENLVKKTREEFKDAKIIVTTGTHTGQNIAHKKFENIANLITYFPFDRPQDIRRFLDKINPTTVLIAETEIWPNFAFECKKRDINLYIINGRISDSTFKSYEYFKFVFKRFLNFYTGILTQSEDDNNKFLKLGANPSTTKKMNNLKFDIKKPNVDIELDKKGKRVFLAGSTHSGEDEIVFKVFKKLKDKHSDLRLILAPRHLTRIDEIKTLLEKYQFKYDLRSSGNVDFENSDILVLDTLGELGKMYNFSDISFIGGSFNKTGGHNPLESLVFSKPVISGPSIHNFKDIYTIISNANAGFVVKNEDEFFEITDKLLTDGDFYLSTVDECSKVFNEQQGALEFVIQILKH